MGFYEHDSGENWTEKPMALTMSCAVAVLREFNDFISHIVEVGRANVAEKVARHLHKIDPV